MQLRVVVPYPILPSISCQPDAGLCHLPLLSGFSPASLMLGYVILPYCQVSPASLMLDYVILPYYQVSCQPDAGLCHPLLLSSLSPTSLMLGYAILPYCQVSLLPAWCWDMPSNLTVKSLLQAWCWAMPSSLTVRFFSCHLPLLSSLSPASLMLEYATFP